MEQKTMKALVYQEPHKYDLMDVPVPQIIETGDVIGKVTLAAICTSDIHLVHGELTRGVYPRIPGHEFCVEIVEVGSEVKKFKVGDRCVVRPGVACRECMFCKVGVTSACVKGGVFGVGPLDGSHAEFIRIPFADMEGEMFPIPDDLTEEQAILVPDMLGTAFYGLKNVGDIEGETVAVVGVGPVGQSTCLLAKKLYGAKTVIAIDILQERVDLALKAGVADIGLNPSTDNMAEKIKELTGGIGVDVTIETAGVAEGMIVASAITRSAGVIFTLSLFSEQYVGLPMNEMIGKGLELKFGVQKQEGIADLLQLVHEGKIDPRFILTHKAPLNDIVKGYETFGNQQDGCVKWVITPYER